MKLLFVLVSVLITIKVRAEFPDLSGLFRGICTSTERDGKIRQRDGDLRHGSSQDEL